MEKEYLENLKNKKLNVTIFLTCNVKLQGIIQEVDENSLLLVHDDRIQLIYKHAISTISAGNSFKG